MEVPRVGVEQPVDERELLPEQVPQKRPPEQDPAPVVPGGVALGVATQGFLGEVELCLGELDPFVVVVALGTSRGLFVVPVVFLEEQQRTDDLPPPVPRGVDLRVVFEQGRAQLQRLGVASVLGAAREDLVREAREEGELG